MLRPYLPSFPCRSSRTTSPCCWLQPCCNPKPTPPQRTILTVQELLRYISVLLALQPRLDDGAASADAQPDGAASPAGAPQAGGGRGGKAVGTLLLLDVEMAAPVITMPRCSDSRDALEVDLGHLQLRNALTWRGGAGAGDRRARPRPASRPAAQPALPSALESPACARRHLGNCAHMELRLYSQPLAAVGTGAVRRRQQNTHMVWMCLLTGCGSSPAGPDLAGDLGRRRCSWRRTGWCCATWAPTWPRAAAAAAT